MLTILTDIVSIMKLSTRVRYAARIMLDLALSGNSKPISGKDIAERQEISQSYLDNIMGPLKAAGLIRTIRGAGGGFILAKPLMQINMNDIWRAMEGPVCLVDCIDQPDSCDRHGRCVTRDVWQEADKALKDVFESWNLEDMVQKVKLY